MNNLFQMLMGKVIGDHLEFAEGPQVQVGHPCYLCGRHDVQTFPTIWPTYRKGDLRWICRNHLLPGDFFIHALTGQPVYVYGNKELWPELCDG